MLPPKNLMNGLGIWYGGFFRIPCLFAVEFIGIVYRDRAVPTSVWISAVINIKTQIPILVKVLIITPEFIKIP